MNQTPFQITTPSNHLVTVRWIDGVPMSTTLFHFPVSELGPVLEIIRQITADSYYYVITPKGYRLDFLSSSPIATYEGEIHSV